MLLHTRRQRWWLPPLIRATWDLSKTVPTTPWTRAVRFSQQKPRTNNMVLRTAKGSACRSPNVQPTASTCASCFHQHAWQSIQGWGKVSATKPSTSNESGLQRVVQFVQARARLYAATAASEASPWRCLFGLGVQCAWMAHLQRDHAYQAPKLNGPHRTTSTRDMCFPLGEVA